MKKALPNILTSIVICLAIGLLSSFAVQSTVDGWYDTLNKPSFNPPKWVFGPVWTILYILMGISAGMVWSKGFYHKWVKTAMYHFIFQLLLNGLWSVVFFGFKSIGFALLIIFGLLVLIVLTYKWFKIVNATAAYLLIPYFLWVCFATVLNFTIWYLN